MPEEISISIMAKVDSINLQNGKLTKTIKNMLEKYQ
jgi:hypothetical protein